MRCLGARVIAALCVGFTIALACAAPSQPLRLDDLFALESFDGAPAAARVALAPGEAARNLTQGQTDQSGWLAPVWSPDALHLALLSTRGGGLRLWVWSRDDGALPPALDFAVSPRKDRIAFFRPTAVFEPGSADILAMNKADDRSTLEVVDLEGHLRFSGSAHDIDALPASARWSLDGRELAFLAYASDRTAPPRLGRVDSTSGRVRWIDIGTLDAAPLERDVVLARPQMEWTARGEILLWAAERLDRKTPRTTSRRDWWLIQRNGTHHALTARLKQETRGLRAEPGRTDVVFVVADGDLWRLPTRAGDPENLTAKPRHRDASVRHSRSRRSAARSIER